MALEIRNTSTSTKTRVAYGNSHLPGMRVNIRYINSTRGTSSDIYYIYVLPIADFIFSMVQFCWNIWGKREEVRRTD